MDSVKFGAEMRDQFDLSSDYLFINHGSWGTIPKCVEQEKKRLQDEIESNPDRFFRWKKADMMREITEIAAKFVGADPDNLVFVANATSGINTILKSFQLQDGDAVLTNRLTYGAVQRTGKAVCEGVEGSQYHELEITFPIESEDSIVEIYENYLSEHPHIKLAVIDYITSSTALLMPVKGLIEVCRRHNILVMVDGAHSPGHVPLNLEELGADFYTGNLHKWAYAPRGCAILWVHPKHKSWVHPLVVSWGRNLGFHREFLEQATIDYTSYLASKAGLQFYNDIGGYEKIHEYTSSLSITAAEMLVKAWNTYQLPVPQSMRAPNMKSIKLPKIPYVKEYGNTEEDAVKVMGQLFTDYKINTCVCVVAGELYCRISAQIYNTMADYEALRQAVLDISKQAQ